MQKLTSRDRELVALGAAVAANCIPCVEHHIPVAREAGLTDAELIEALELAEIVRQVPARKVMETARNLVSGVSPGGEGPAKTNACAEALQAKEKGSACC